MEGRWVVEKQEYKLGEGEESGVERESGKSGADATDCSTAEDGGGGVRRCNPR
jgi:hypothetical protein